MFCYTFPPVLLVKTPLLGCISQSTSMQCTAACSSFPFCPPSTSLTLISTMKRFAFYAMRPSIQGQQPRGYINSTVRTMPPSRQLPSASIPTREMERRGARRARGCDSLERKRKGGKRRGKIGKKKKKRTGTRDLLPRGEGKGRSHCGSGSLTAELSGS